MSLDHTKDWYNYRVGEWQRYEEGLPADIAGEFFPQAPGLIALYRQRVAAGISYSDALLECLSHPMAEQYEAEKK